MGLAQHLGEGNLPKALFHLERSQNLFEKAFGLNPAGDAAVGYRRILFELIYVHGEMDHHEEKIAYVELMSKRLNFDVTPLAAWPLLKLKRFDEARRAARAAVDRAGPEDSTWRAVGLTALCAIESEMRERFKAYDACMAAADTAMKDQLEGGVALSNAAASAMEIFKFDEAERLYNEAARRPVEGTINPWARLLHLYLRQGRFAEAVGALREMKAYRLSRPAYFDQQDQADAEIAGAAVLIIAGRTEDALRISSRTVARPDRQGTSSAAFEQNEAGNWIVDRAIRLDAARRLEEEASWSPFSEAVKLRARAAKLRVEAWIEAKKVAGVLADRERLTTTLRPECPGSLEVPSWLDAEVIGIVGSGVARAAIKEARIEEVLPPENSEPVFKAFEAEAALLAGDDREALEAAVSVVERLAPTEALAKARAAAIGAEAAVRLGRAEEATALFEVVLRNDPGLIRRLGLTLPVSVTTDGSPAAVEAASMIGRSPRFDVASWGFRLELGQEAVRLTNKDGSELLAVEVPPGNTSGTEQIARRIARTAHFELFVPNVDVTQADIHSLDGGLTGGGSAAERARNILQDLLGP
jgi:tetratricopeptide (TPR) repeat protein